MERVASDADDYVNKAVRLAADADYRAAVGREIHQAAPWLFEDLEAVREHEQLFLRFIEES